MTWRRAALAACAGLLAGPLAAQPPACFDSVRSDPAEAFGSDHIAVTIQGRRGPCSSVRVAAIGDEAVLGAPFTHELNIVVATREHALPPGVCPEPAENPFTLTAHLPERLAASNPHDGPHVVGLFLRREDASGGVLSVQPCEELGIFVEPGTRDIARLHHGRFWVSVEWKTGSTQGLGWVVPSTHDPPADAALYWFFRPENWELLVKVLNGCAINGHWWVLGAAATNVEFELQIRDTFTGDTWVRTNPAGTLAPAFADHTAFEGCAIDATSR